MKLIVRTIVPIIDMDSRHEDDGASGMGDIVQSFFFSPKQPTAGGWVWAVGAGFSGRRPRMTCWAANNGASGRRHWHSNRRTDQPISALANHLWSYAGHDSRDLRECHILPALCFLHYPKQTTIGLNAESTYNWNSDEWTIPLNVTLSQLSSMAAIRCSSWWAAPLLLRGKPGRRSGMGPARGRHAAVSRNEHPLPCFQSTRRHSAGKPDSGSGSRWTKGQWQEALANGTLPNGQPALLFAAFPP